MTTQKKEWTYFDQTAGNWVSPYLSREELHDRYKRGEVRDHTPCVSVRMIEQGGPGGTQGIPYSSLSKLDVEFNPTIEEFLTLRAGKPVSILSGPNNGGKSLLLKQLFSVVGHSSYLIGCNRFSHVDTLNSRKRESHEHRRYYDNFMRQFERSQQNTENNELNLEHVITGLKDHERQRLFQVAGDLIGNSFRMERIDPENEFSPFQVMMDDENLRYGSSGTRLFLTIMGILLDQRFSTLLVDEPEIGLSPRIQARLASFLFDPAERASYCPHVKQLYVATHSHIFLDRSTYSNNFVVTKNGKQITARAIGSVSDLHQLQFNMLGNELESLFLPSAIVIVEGESDITFLNKVLELHLPGVRVAMVCAHGEGEVRSKVSFFKEAFGDVASSLYRGRLFVVFDKQISTKLERIATQGVLAENTIVLSQNGIEQYYPKQLLSAAFHCDIADVGNIDLERDLIEYNGLRHSKKELAKFVADGLTIAHGLDPEVEDFVSKLRCACK